MSASSEITKTKIDNKTIASHRVIADHLRASSFLIAEGVLPSNEGRGYVLRRIMRRGMRHAHTLGSKNPIFYQLFDVLLSEMSQSYPELKNGKDFDFDFGSLRFTVMVCIALTTVPSNGIFKW